MTAAGTNQEADAVVEALGRGLAGDGSGVRRAATVRLTLAGDLSAAVWIHAVNKPIWKTQEGQSRREGGTGKRVRVHS